MPNPAYELIFNAFGPKPLARTLAATVIGALAVGGAAWRRRADAGIDPLWMTAAGAGMGAFAAIIMFWCDHLRETPPQKAGAAWAAKAVVAGLGILVAILFATVLVASALEHK